MYAEDRLAPAFVAQDEAFRNTLQSSWPGPVAFNTEYLEFLRRPGEVEEKLMLELLERKYESRRPDLVVTSTSVGLEFLLRHRARLFTGIPIVFMSVMGAGGRLTIPRTSRAPGCRSTGRPRSTRRSVCSRKPARCSS